jgi:hypothetical protein
VPVRIDRDAGAFAELHVGGRRGQSLTSAYRSAADCRRAPQQQRAGETIVVSQFSAKTNR